MSGVVVMADGAPAAGARVRAEPCCSSTKADAEGRFELEDLCPQVREINARTEDGLVASTRIDLAEGGAVSDVRLVIETPVRSFVHVRVLDARGRGVPDASVTGGGRHTSTDADGLATAVLSEPAGTEVELSVWAERFAGTSVLTRTFPSRSAPFLDVALRDAVLVEVDARAPDGTKVDPSVRFDGGSAREADRGPGWYLDPEAEYVARVWARGFLPLELPAWRPPRGGGVLSVSLRPRAGVRGRVVNADGTLPAKVVVAIKTGAGRDSLECGPDGGFLLENLEEGRAVLSVGSADWFPAAAVEVSTVSGQVTDVGTLTLARPVTLSGRVVGPDSRPLGGARVLMRTRLPSSYEEAYSHSDGTFRILAPGFVPGVLVVSKGGFGTTRTEVGAGEGRAVGDIVLPKPGSVEFEVVGLDPDDDSVSIALALPGGSVVERTDYDDSPGRMEDLAPGGYVARLLHGETTLEQEVQVVAGETAKVTFRLER